jgi:hypothetical protein
VDSQYRDTIPKDLNSKKGNCGPLPEKVDVIKLHKDTLAYTEQAQKILKESLEKSGQGSKNTNTNSNPEKLK